jgi:SWI/SNF-related matrix-associated actin-dependent regulator of chromatin subfamily A3
MTQRETGPVPLEFRLWQPIESDGQALLVLEERKLAFKFLLIIRRYRHAVTNAESRIQHSETGGGILADEMGMGKSLSILSLITKTLDDAHSWAENQSVSLSNNVSAIKRPSPATLVVVSSACKFFS